MPVADAAEALSIHYNLLYRWVSEYEEYGEGAFPGHGTALYSCQYEIKKLMQENYFIILRECILHWDISLSSI